MQVQKREGAKMLEIKKPSEDWALSSETES